MDIVNLPYKKFGIEFDGKYVVLKMLSKNVKESIKMNLESLALLKILLEQSVIVSEKINKKFKKDKIKVYKIKDIGTVFGIDGRVSIGVLPADENRIASILIGFHKDDKHVSIVLKPKKIALLCIVISKIISENLKLN
ncbi:conserved protein of unknown function [Methanocaldococcus lauensis]|nr:conserved protein of unknown function [Methanocaldococcus lauensis]